MALKGLNILSLPNPTGGAAYANAFAKINPARVIENDAGGVDVFCVVQYYTSAQARIEKKAPLAVDVVTLTYTAAEWAALNQASAYDKLKTLMELPVIPVSPETKVGFGWTGVTTIPA